MDNIFPIWRQFIRHGMYGKGASIENAQGYLYYIPNEDWCKPVLPRIQNSLKPWIALIERGNCNFEVKILNAKAVNASAVVIFDNGSSKNQGSLQMKSYRVGIVAVSISREAGLKLVSLFVSYKVFLQIEVGRYHYRRKRDWEAGKTSVLFVLVSFILLMCISLAWLVFYYVQRFRYFYARDKKEKQLANAAKKAIAKLKTRVCDGLDTLEDQEETCAVCLEGYLKGETLRTLSCRHEFHKICIDPWLLEHRTCPICKTNILKEFGIEVPENSGDRNFDVTAASSRTIVAFGAQEGQTEALNTPLQEIHSHQNTDDETANLSANNTSLTSTDDEDSLTNSTSVLVSQEYA
eukprot:gene399-10066_t